ncbi:hypothetical protein D3C85_1155100 [compost metagenome]
MGEGFHRQVLAIVLLHQFDEAPQQLPVAFVAAAGRRVLLAAPADPDHEDADQGIEHQVASRRAALVFVEQGSEQGVDVAAVGPHRVAARRGQHRQRCPQLCLQLFHQGRAQGQHVALDVLGELEAVDTERRGDLDRRFEDFAASSLHLHHRLAALYVEQLEQVGVAVRLDLPVVQAAALGNGFAVQQVGGRPGLVLAIELEYGDAWNAGLHGLAWGSR